ncbi:MAG TPA: DnaJ domain-containing protein [Candidatus Kapabacteria bacterium]|nr:DnaJ domain-containing protein [Candidatus Kapabacteria bacterium]
MVKHIVEHPVPLVLRDILREKSHGELIVRGRNFTRNLFFEDGNLVFAGSNVIEERLGEILFKIGKIDRRQFIEILEMLERKATNEKLGKVLVQKKILSQRDLFFALLYQLRAIATSVFALVSGEWQFIDKIPDIPSDSRFNIELPGIIIEGANKIGNFSYFKNRFYRLTPRIGPIPEKMKEFLSTYETGFYGELTGFTNITCEQIIPQLEISEDIFWKKIILFYLLNIVEFNQVSTDREMDKNVEDLFILYERIRSDKIDFYELLGLQKTATFNEIKDAYFNIAKKYHPDRISNAPDPEIKEKANFVFAEMNKAYDNLSNDDKKRAYDSKGYKEGSIEDSIKDNLLERAKMLYRRAKALYTQKQYGEAVPLLEEAVALDTNKPPYFLMLGLCQMNLPALRRAAEKSLQKVIDQEPWNVEAYTAMGMLFLSENQVNRAEGFFRKVLSLNPDHALARKKLQELLDSRTDKTKHGFSIFGKTKK